MKKGENKLGFLGLVIFVLGLIVFNTCTYTLQYDEVAVVRRLGKVQKVIVNDYDIVKESVQKSDRIPDEVVISTRKGLHFKMPFLDTVEKTSSKLVTYVSTPTVVNTNDRRRINRCD